MEKCTPCTTLRIRGLIRTVRKLYPDRSVLDPYIDVRLSSFGSLRASLLSNARVYDAQSPHRKNGSDVAPKRRYARPKDARLPKSPRRATPEPACASTAGGSVEAKRGTRPCFEGGGVWRAGLMQVLSPLPLPARLCEPGASSLQTARPPLLR